MASNSELKEFEELVRKEKTEAEALMQMDSPIRKINKLQKQAEANGREWYNAFLKKDDKVMLATAQKALAIAKQAETILNPLRKLVEKTFLKSEIWQFKLDSCLENIPKVITFLKQKFNSEKDKYEIIEHYGAWIGKLSNGLAGPDFVYRALKKYEIKGYLMNYKYHVDMVNKLKSGKSTDSRERAIDSIIASCARKELARRGKGMDSINLFHEVDALTQKVWKEYNKIDNGACKEFMKTLHSAVEKLQKAIDK